MAFPPGAITGIAGGYRQYFGSGVALVFATFIVLTGLIVFVTSQREGLDKLSTNLT
jgi:hypothetical protein